MGSPYPNNVGDTELFKFILDAIDKDRKGRAVEEFIAPGNNLDNIVRTASFVERLAQQEVNHKEVNINSR